MRCSKCGSENLKCPNERSALEIFKCLDCGEEIAVHCLYPIREEFLIKRQAFHGYFLLTDGQSSAKCFLKLKNILKKCECFNLSRLEAQRLSGRNKWDLGTFWDSELENVQLTCEQNSIEIFFEKI